MRISKAFLSQKFGPSNTRRIKVICIQITYTCESGMMECKTFKSYREFDIARTNDILNLEILQNVTMNIFVVQTKPRKKTMSDWDKRLVEKGP